MQATSPVKTVLIIGGGVAGLAAGCYAQTNGFQATILEKHKIAGGLCTAWTRRGYTFDTSLHMLSHSRKGGFLKMWREMGVIQGRTLVDHPDRGLLEYGGERFTPPIDLDELERVMLARSPTDAAPIHEMLEAARKCADFNLAPDKPFALMGVAELISFGARNLGLLRFMRKWGRIQVRDYAARFKDPLLREFVGSMESSVSWPMADVSMATLLITLNMAHEHNMSYVIGGSYAVAQTMVQRFVQLGGNLRTRTHVDGIITRPDGARDRAVGVRLDDGSELHADYVISAADGKTTIWNWLGGRYLNDAVTKAYATWKVFPPLVQVMLGVARSFEGESYAQSFPLATPIRVAERGFERMEVLIYNYDPTLTPAGKTGLQVWYTTDYDWWRRLAANRPAYEAEKLRIATEVIDALEARWPGLRARVEVVDVTTPHTFRRYTGNEQGSPDGWCSTVETGFLQLHPALPGLSHFYMAGQWTMPFAGVPGSCMSGRDAIQYICHDEKRAFVTSEPPTDWRAPVIPAPVDEGKATLHVLGTATAPPLAQVTGNGSRPLSAVRIETASCTGCGDCADIAPEVFGVGEDGRARLTIEQFGPELEAAVRRALEGCPEHAIVALEPVTA